MIKIEDVAMSATNNIPAKTSYNIGGNTKQRNEIYYFGTPPEKPKSLSNYLKKNTQKNISKK